MGEIMRNIIDYTKNYMQKNFEEYQVIYRRKKILEIIKLYEHNNILEIGCGMEPLFKYLDYQDYDNMIIIEPSELFFKNAIKLSSNNSKITCINDFFGEKVLKNKYKLNLIICSSLLHEIEDPKNFLLNIYNICDKNTIIHINVPNANSLHRILAKEIGLINNIYEKSNRNIKLQQREVYDIDKLSSEVERCGFKILDKGSYFIKPFSHNQMMDMLNNNIIDEHILNGFYNLEKYLPEYGSEIYVNIIKK